MTLMLEKWIISTTKRYQEEDSETMENGQLLEVYGEG
jgi:hypothetical protein